MRGSCSKRPAASEKTTRRNNRKSLVLARGVKAGERLTADNVAIKRPGYGIPPKFREQVLGRAASRDLEPDSVLGWDDLG
jgi:N-acetylneuraminate synthase